MFEDKKNLKDSQNLSQVQYGLLADAPSFRLSYAKTNKLVTALYMVTDILENTEPIRLKLRTLGIEVISDIESLHLSSRAGLDRVYKRVSEIITFLEIAGTVHLISEMNGAILKREFLELMKSIEVVMGKLVRFSGETNLEEFLKIDLPVAEESYKKDTKKSIGRIPPTRLGLHRPDTLMKALSDKAASMSDTKDKFDMTKRQRREEIISIIKKYVEMYPALGGATITDIRTKAEGVLVSCGEKTLQRELVSMVAENILYKVGEKRWSRYSIRR